MKEGVGTANGCQQSVTSRNSNQTLARLRGICPITSTLQRYKAQILTFGQGEEPISR